MMLRVLPAIALLALPCAAGASTTHDLRGTWACCGPGGAANQTWTITSMDQSSGVFSGTGGGGSYTFPVTGTADGNAVTFTTGPYDQLPSYSATFTGTISADSKSMAGDWGNSSQSGTWKATRDTVPPGSGGGGGGGGGEPPPNLPPECVNPTTLLATCANAAGPPAVCGPSGTILPQCNYPLVLPTVCGPSNTILVACTGQGPYVVACGGFGTILPQCTLPPPQLPQVCGPSTGTILPACTGANNPVTVCGPSGTALPQCNFGGRINATPLDTGSSTGAITLTLSCVNSLASSARRAAAAQAKPKCDATAVILSARNALRASLHQEANSLSRLYEDAADRGREARAPLSAADPLRDLTIGTRNAQAFRTRADAMALSRLGVTGVSYPDKIVSPSPLIAQLGGQAGPPAYAGPTDFWGAAYVYDAPGRYAAKMIAAVDEIRKLFISNAQGSLARPSAKAPTRIVKRIKLRAGQRKVRVRVKLPRAFVRGLVREVGKKGRRAAVRVIVSFRAKPRPVARFVDLPLRIKRGHARRR
jgi:hypothetical protein